MALIVCLIIQHQRSPLPLHTRVDEKKEEKTPRNNETCQPLPSSSSIEVHLANLCSPFIYCH